LSTISSIEINLGKYKLKQVKCQVNKCKYAGNRFFQVPEEKRIDVNIGIYMLNNAINEDINKQVLVSGDSDLVPVLKMVKNSNLNIETIVYIPANIDIRSYAVELRGSADKHKNKHKTLPNILLPKAQFPIKIMNPAGGWINKPDDW